MRRVSGWVIGVVLCGAALYALAEDLTLTTYYPSPRGVYKELRATDSVAIGAVRGPWQPGGSSPLPTHRLLVAGQGVNRVDNLTCPAGTDWYNEDGSGFVDDGECKSTVIITPTGQVGIGTTSPSTMLDVNGQVRIRGGSPDTGQVLTATDATGLARWQSPTGTQWKRIAVLNEVVDSIATDDLPAACTTSNGVCSGMLILVRSGSPADQSLLFQYLHSGGGRWHSAFADGQADGSASGGSGVNGDAVPRTIVNATLCTLYDDSGVEMSASKWTLRVSDINYSCEVWVSGF